MRCWGKRKTYRGETWTKIRGESRMRRKKNRWESRRNRGKICRSVYAKGNTSLTPSDQPTSLTKTSNRCCYYWFPFISFSVLEKNRIFNSRDPAILQSLSLFTPLPTFHAFRLFATLTHDQRRIIISKCFFDSNDARQRIEFDLSNFILRYSEELKIKKRRSLENRDWIIQGFRDSQFRKCKDQDIQKYKNPTIRRF